MPEISRFLGIKIIMWYNDHGEPHFHARYGEDTAKFEIENAALSEGQLPPRVTALVVEWALLHRTELLKAWDMIRQEQKPRRIKGLA